MDAMKVYQEWKDKLEGYENLRAQLDEIEGNEEEITERFGKEITFGTAGLRGKIGVGCNCMNEIVVGRATQGIADFIKEQGKEYMERGLVIAHDCRHFSKEFSRLVAEIMAANGIKVFTFPDLRPTPELAFTIRKLHAASGINITASHNPKEYNGYKVYWESGAQVMEEIADQMLAKINQVDYFGGVTRMDFEEGVEKGLIEVLSDEMDRSYLDLIKSLSLRDGEELDKDIPIVYTPLNGAGSIPVRTILKERGFTNVHIVPEQKDPDPDFTSVGYPNPEDTKAFKLAEKLGLSVGADILIATDPDSDRLAVEVKNNEGGYTALNGNQTGVLLINYILESLDETGKLPANGAMVKSIVTGEMGTAICKAYGVKMFETLTGFKNICGKIPYLEEHDLKYLFGYEESIGYAISPDVRDKDGISAAMYLSEASAYYRKKGKTLLNVLEDLYEKYGYYKEDQVSIVLEGMAGAARISRMMEALRADSPKEFGKVAVKEVIDYKDGYQDIDKSNVLKYILEDESWFSVRPSGTEPKIKLYIYVKGASEEAALNEVAMIKEDILAKLYSVE